MAEPMCVFQCVVACCRVFQCVVVCCSVLQYVAVCHSVSDVQGERHRRTLDGINALKYQSDGYD